MQIQIPWVKKKYKQNETKQNQKKTKTAETPSRVTPVPLLTLEHRIWFY